MTSGKAAHTPAAPPGVFSLAFGLHITDKILYYNVRMYRLQRIPEYPGLYIHAFSRCGFIQTAADSRILLRIAAVCPLHKNARIPAENISTVRQFITD